MYQVGEKHQIVYQICTKMSNNGQIYVISPHYTFFTTGEGLIILCRSVNNRRHKPNYDQEIKAIKSITHAPRQRRHFDVSFLCVVKTQRRWSKKIYKTELTKTRYNNQVLGKYRVDPQRAGLTLIAELTWSNLGLKGVLNKRK